MTFFINGASYTSGEGLEHPERDAWPVVFGEKTNSSIVNVSESGASIDYVVYSTIKELSFNNYKKVIINLPSLHRLLMVRRENNYFLHTAIGRNHFFLNNHTTGYIYRNDPEYKDYVKLYYKYWSNHLYDLKFSLQKIILLQEYLKSRNCQYLFLNTNNYYLNKWLTLTTLDYQSKCWLIDNFDNFNDEQILAEELEIKSLYQQIDTTYYYDPINFNLADWTANINSINNETGHPTVDGHIRIAEFIEPLWNNLYGTDKEL